jgi:hypothetical protein
MSKVLYITEEYLDQLFDELGARVVGKLLGKIELYSDNDKLKQIAKSTVYEGFRDIKYLIIAYNKGVELSTFKFKRDLTKEG